MSTHIKHKQLYVELLVQLPEDPFAAADVYKALQPAWGALLDALKGSGAGYDIKFKEMDRTTGKMPRKARKPKLTPVPNPEAA